MAQQLKTQYEFLFVGRDQGSFVENYAYDLGDGEEDGGKVFINLEIEQNKVDADKIGEIIFDNLRKIFYADLTINPYDRFEESLKEVNKALNAYRQERGSDFLGKMNVLIVAVVNNQIYVTQTGDAEAYLIRRKFITSISEGPDEQADNEVFTNIASGDLESEDWVLLCSTRVLRYISKTELAKLVGNNFRQSLSNVEGALSTEVLNKTAIIAVAALNEIDGHKVKPSHDGDQAVLEEAVKMSQAGDSSEKKENGMIPNLKNVNLRNVGGILKKCWRENIQTMKSFVRGFNSKTERGSQLDIKTWSKEKILIAIGFLFLILVIGVWGLKAKSDQDKKITTYANQLVLVQEQINSAITTSRFDKDRATTMLNDAEKQAITVYNSGLYKAKAGELLQSIADTRDKMDGVIHPKFEQLGDLTTKRANVSALGLIELGNQIYAYEYNALYPLLGGKLADPLTIDDNEKVVSAVGYDDQGTILFLTATGKILELKNERINMLTTVDGNFKKGTVLKAYGNKIYILDSADNQIWRYVRHRDNFGPAQAYATGVNLSKAVDFAIDGNIYVLNSDGSIIKLYQGNPESLPIKRHPTKPMTNPTKIYTNADMNQVYILEPSQNRILVYEKDSRSGGLNYENQYIVDELTNLQDIYVDKNTNMLYLLTKTGIYRTSLVQATTTTAKSPF